jgi:hypothetical protein
MAARLGPLSISWPGKASAEDPYWDFFINERAADPGNAVTELIRQAPEGGVYPLKADVHTPEVSARHVKELARSLGADLVGIVGLGSHDEEISQGYPFAIVTAVQAQYDPRESAGIGGQVAVQNGMFVTFVLSAYIRELGYRATASADPAAERLAVAAGLGRLNAAGRLVAPRLGSRVHVANLIRTDLPLLADG